jgi:GT2 family glycosyltransferase
MSSEVSGLMNQILWICVLFNTSPSKSVSIQSLTCIFAAEPDVMYSLLVYDNSPAACCEKFDVTGNVNFEYFNNPDNPGIASAYNFGLQKAIESGIKWIALLDQDSKLDDAYIKYIYESLDACRSNTQIAAFVPMVFDQNGNLFSPAIMSVGGRIRRFRHISTGIQSGRMTAINSGTLLNVDLMKSLGGFNEVFHLDMLDHWYFNEIYRLNRKVYVMKSRMLHDLSVLDFKNNVSITRYQNILESEYYFIRNYGNILDVWFYKIRLLARIFKQIKFKDVAYLKKSFKYLVKI